MTAHIINSRTHTEIECSCGNWTHPTPANLGDIEEALNQHLQHAIADESTPT